MKVWHFDDKPANWSPYLESFASSLFSNTSTGDAEEALVVEEMELAGVIGELQSNGSREVLAPPPPKD